MKTQLLAILAATTAFATMVQADEVIFAHGSNPGNPRFVAAEKWAELYAECSGDTVNHAPSATMGDDVEMLTSATAGVIQVTANSQGPLAQIVPEIGLLGLPFLFSDLPTAWAVLDGEVGDQLDTKAQERGLKILGFWDNGIRHVSHMSKGVSSPEDIKGMKIRTPPDDMSVAIFEALGAAPAPLAFSELPTALQSGVFDGQENPLTNIHSSNIHEITKHITLTAHQYQSTPVVAGMVWWSSLSPEKQECALQATHEAGKLQREMSVEQDENLGPQMEEEGVTFYEADRDAYVEATKAVYDKYAEQFPEMVPALQAAAAEK